MTAERSAAYSDAAHHLGLIPDTDLTKLYSGAEYRCQILYELPEVNSAVRCKVKQQLVSVKCILCIHQLHLKSVLDDFLLADGKCLFFLFLISLNRFLILVGCHSDDRLKR